MIMSFIWTGIERVGKKLIEWALVILAFHGGQTYYQDHKSEVHSNIEKAAETVKDGIKKEIKEVVDVK